MEEELTPTAESPIASLTAQIAEDLQDERLELPGFPEAVLRIQRTLRSPDTSADDVVKILRSEPALAARALQIANSAQFRPRHHAITELRTAVSRLGFNLVRSVAVAFAIRQLRLREAYSAAARAEIESTWRDSLKVASTAYVLARHCGGVNPEEALLAGLLHVLGRLYVVMRAEGVGGSADVQSLRTASGWQGELARLILASWELPEALQHAVAHQDDLEYEAAEVSVTDVLIAAKHIAAGGDASRYSVLARVLRGKDPAAVLDEHADELRALTSSLE